MNFEYQPLRVVVHVSGGRTLLAGLLIYTSNSYVQLFCYVAAVFRWTSSIGFIKISGGLLALNLRWHNSILPTFTFSVEKATKCCVSKFILLNPPLYIYFMEIYLHRLMNVLYMCMCTWRAMICHYLSENTASNISRWHYINRFLFDRIFINNQFMLDVSGKMGALKLTTTIFTTMFSYDHQMYNLEDAGLHSLSILCVNANKQKINYNFLVVNKYFD
ncbi:hypothetical protein ACJX0J_028242 [Zea mays]